MIPVSFDEAAFSKNRLSLPTKLAEASPAALLVYGPAGAAPVEFCRRHRVGSFIDERSVERVAAHLRHAAANRAGARAAATSGREFIREHYTAARVRDTFRAILRNTATAS